MYKTFEQINVRSIVQNHWKKKEWTNHGTKKWRNTRTKYLSIYACRIFWNKMHKIFEQIHVLIYVEIAMQKRVKLSGTSPHWLWLALRTDPRLMRK